MRSEFSRYFPLLQHDAFNHILFTVCLEKILKTVTILFYYINSRSLLTKQFQNYCDMSSKKCRRKTNQDRKSCLIKLICRCKNIFEH